MTELLPFGPSQTLVPKGKGPLNEPLQCSFIPGVDQPSVNPVQTLVLFPRTGGGFRGDVCRGLRGGRVFSLLTSALRQ